MACKTVKKMACGGVTKMATGGVVANGKAAGKVGPGATAKAMTMEQRNVNALKGLAAKAKAPNGNPKATVAKAPNRAEGYKAGVLADRLAKTKPAKATKQGSPKNKSNWEAKFDSKIALLNEQASKLPLTATAKQRGSFVDAGMKRKGK